MCYKTVSSDSVTNETEDFAFCHTIKAEDAFILLSDGYYRFKVVGCLCEVLPHTAKHAALPVARLKLLIENQESPVFINHVLFVTVENNKVIHSFFSSIDLAKEGVYVPQWQSVVGRSGGCYVTQKTLDFKTVNIIDHFITKT